MSLCHEFLSPFFSSCSTLHVGQLQLSMMAPRSLEEHQSALTGCKGFRLSLNLFRKDKNIFKSEERKIYISVGPFKHQNKPTHVTKQVGTGPCQPGCCSLDLFWFFPTRHKKKSLGFFIIYFYAIYFSILFHWPIAVILRLQIIKQENNSVLFILKAKSQLI